MSHGPPRAYSSYSTIPNRMNNNPPSFQTSLISNNNNNGSTTSGSTQETLYCDSCQTFRHVSFFNERDFKYNVCNICHSREIQKRKHQLERYEIYEEQQRTLKQAKYQAIQYPTQPPAPAPAPAPTSSTSNAPITLNNSPPPSTSSSPATTSSSVMHTLNPSPKYTPTMRNQSQLQSHMQPSLPSLPSQPESPTLPPQEFNSKSLTPISNPIFDSPTPSSSSSSKLTEKDSTIDLDQFVKELEKETEFDRKQYQLDIEALMESLGENAGFTQLGRGICEKVLEGTTFNFR